LMEEEQQSRPEPSYNWIKMLFIFCMFVHNVFADLGVPLQFDRSFSVCGLRCEPLRSQQFLSEVRNRISCSGKGGLVWIWNLVDFCARTTVHLICVGPRLHFTSHVRESQLSSFSNSPCWWFWPPSSDIHFFIGNSDTFVPITIQSHIQLIERLYGQAGHTIPFSILWPDFAFKCLLAIHSWICPSCFLTISR
jgi:hypothetical protein